KRKDDQTWKMLVEDEPRPLNSFYTKIAVGYALGIYDLGMRTDLNIVRNIRNAFAHSPKQIKFDHPAIVKELKKATRSALPKVAWKGLKAQDCYVRLCVSLSLKLSRIRIRRSSGGVSCGRISEPATEMQSVAGSNHNDPQEIELRYGSDG